MRFDARHIGFGVWGVWDGGVMSWKATDLPEKECDSRLPTSMSFFQPVQAAQH